ncbi:hypothetical protein KI387_025856 [Taxus chinensis]|uniref:RING-type E3 ubiquitin transferase n=1 Tax=Taxus chinensis TaxID=29808 RepID=A0AA38KZG6_TAXCH|nr:hypothetical protein KI387_025856 [Taxus chinensis]
MDVTDEVREQVELLHKQSRRAGLFVDPAEELLCNDVLSVLRVASFLLFRPHLPEPEAHPYCLPILYASPIPYTTGVEHIKVASATNRGVRELNEPSPTARSQMRVVSVDPSNNPATLEEASEDEDVISLWHAFDTVITLDTNFRQQGLNLTQLEFREMLTNIRNAEATVKDWSLLMSRIKDARSCRREIDLLEDEIRKQSNCGTEATVSMINSLIGLVRYCKCVLFGVAEECYDKDEQQAVGFSKVSSTENIQVPDDFRCPISLDLMRDLAIVATGQTYDRVSITRWIEEGHCTCPKSGQKILHANLIPNHALRSLICQWCEKNGVLFE